MALNLSYGNVPPARGRILLGEQIRNDDWRTLCRLNHELWSVAGENLDGLVFDRETLGTTLTSFNIGVGWTSDLWQPVARLPWRTSNADRSVLWTAGYVRNLDLQIQVFDGAWSLLNTVVLSCVSNTPQWVAARTTLTGLSTNDTRIFQLQLRRGAYAADGEMFHFGAKLGATLVSHIPTS